MKKSDIKKSTIFILALVGTIVGLLLFELVVYFLI